MAITIDRKWCLKCDDYVKAERHGASHLFHLFMSCITLGLWLIDWLFVGTGREFHCSTCGAKARNRKPRESILSPPSNVRARHGNDEKVVLGIAGAAVATAAAVAYWLISARIG